MDRVIDNVTDHYWPRNYLCDDVVECELVPIISLPLLCHCTPVYGVNNTALITNN